MELFIFGAAGRCCIIAILAIPILAEGAAHALPNPSFEVDGIRGKVIDRLEELPLSYFGQAYESKLVARLKDFQQNRCARYHYQICRLLITPTAPTVESLLVRPPSHTEPTSAQLISIGGMATIRLRLKGWKETKTIALTPGKSPHDWVVNGKRFELFAFGLDGPGSTGFSFMFYSRAMPSEDDGKQLMALMDQISGSLAVSVVIRLRDNAGDSGPTSSWYDTTISIATGDLSCRRLANSYHCSFVLKKPLIF